MPAYPLPNVGFSNSSGPVTIHPVEQVDIADNSFYLVSRGAPKREWTLISHGCTWAEYEAIDASYIANAVPGNAITFVWPEDGSTKTTKWVKPPTVTRIDGRLWEVVSVLRE
jgi:hypothetical protein